MKTFLKPLNVEEEKYYLKKMREGSLEAKHILIERNLRLVAHIVKKYHNAGEADDLISVGSIGLIKGIETFEQGKGSQLATYAAKCIENEILMYIRANKKHRANVSLSESVGVDKEGNEITLMDILPLKEESVFSKVETSVLYEKVVALLDKVLTEREQRIIRMRYGIGMRAYTQIDVAQKLHISRSYVSRIEKKAIGKLSKAINCV